VILVDTSVWRYALRRTRPRAEVERERWEEARALPELLERGRAVAHLWVLAELLLGGLPSHAAELYRRLPHARPVAMSVLLELIEGTCPPGIGLIDVGLLAAARRDGLSLWTLDSGLRDQAVAAGLAWPA
jgi:predicted nucleic acid-binding protein